MASFFSLISRVWALVVAHKFWTLIALFIVFGGGYYGYSKWTDTSAETLYVLGTVSRNTIVASVSGSGQVQASNQVDVKPKVAGDITSLPIKSGQVVKKGQVIATIDATAAQQAVVNARLDLEEAKLNLEQSTSQAPIDYQKTKDAVTDAKSDLDDEYENAYTAVSDAFVTLPGVMSEADSLLYDKDITNSAQNVNAYQNLFINVDDATQRSIRNSATRALDDYTQARDAYADTYAQYKKLSRASSPQEIEAMLLKSESTAKLIAQAVSSEVNLIDAVVDQINLRDWTLDSKVVTQQASAHSQLATANSVLSDLSSEAQSLRTAQKAVVTAEQNLEIASIGNPTGDSPFSLQLLKNDVAKKEAALREAEQALADHVVRAPFDGTVASVDINAYETVGTGTTIVTLITNQKTATLSLNEVDAAQVAVGNKATLTFDAVEDLTLTGSVVEIDAVGTVSQGVVSYAVTIAYDSQDDRVKPGMTVNASIITKVKQDVLTVPSSAVKSRGSAFYVLVFDPPLTETGGATGVTSETAPNEKTVTIGISDDTSIEIVSGLDENEQIVVRTSSQQTTTTTSTNNNFRGGPGIRL